MEDTETKDCLYSSIDVELEKPSSGTGDEDKDPRVRMSFESKESPKKKTRKNIKHDDHELKIFTSAPQVKVIGGVIEEAWPRKSVEYEIALTYHRFHWTIRLSIRNLSKLWLYVKSKEAMRSSSQPDLPHLHKVFLSSRSAPAPKATSPDMLALIQSYLQSVLNIPAYLHSSQVLSLLQISASTFDEGGGYSSVREGWLKVRVWLRQSSADESSTSTTQVMNQGHVDCDNPFYNCLCVVKKVDFRPRKWRWVALKHSCLALYSSIVATEPNEVLLFDSQFSIERGVHQTGSRSSFVLMNSAFIMAFEAANTHMVKKWANDIRKAAERSPWTLRHRDESFSPVRRPRECPSRAQWYIDGRDSFKAIYHALLEAKKDIYIAGWWISPEIYLMRPPAEFPESQLLHVLESKARAGVQIYVQLYKEVTVALTLNSWHTKKTLRSIAENSRNIHIMRDPDFIVKSFGLWSHHEKIVRVSFFPVFVVFIYIHLHISSHTM